MKNIDYFQLTEDEINRFYADIIAKTYQYIRPKEPQATIVVSPVAVFVIAVFTAIIVGIYIYTYINSQLYVTG